MVPIKTLKPHCYSTSMHTIDISCVFLLNAHTSCISLFFRRGDRHERRLVRHIALLKFLAIGDAIHLHNVCLKQYEVPHLSVCHLCYPVLRNRLEITWFFDRKQPLCVGRPYFDTHSPDGSTTSTRAVLVSTTLTTCKPMHSQRQHSASRQE